MRNIKALVLAFTLMVSCIVCHAGTNAVVDFKKIIDAYPGTEAVHKKVNDFSRSKQMEYTSKKNALDAEQASLQKLLPSLTEDKAEMMKNELMKKYQSLQEAGSQYDKEIKAYSEKEYTVLKKEVTDVMKKVTDREKIEMVFDINAVYIGGRDITELVIAEFSKSKKENQ